MVQIRKEMEDAARATLPPPVAHLPSVTPEEGGEEAAEAAPDPPEPPKIEILGVDLLQLHALPILWHVMLAPGL